MRSERKNCLVERNWTSASVQFGLARESEWIQPNPAELLAEAKLINLSFLYADLHSFFHSAPDFKTIPSFEINKSANLFILSLNYTSGLLSSLFQSLFQFNFGKLNEKRMKKERKREKARFISDWRALIDWFNGCGRNSASFRPHFKPRKRREDCSHQIK